MNRYTLFIRLALAFCFYTLSITTMEAQRTSCPYNKQCPTVHRSFTDCDEGFVLYYGDTDDCPCTSSISYRPGIMGDVVPCGGDQEEKPIFITDEGIYIAISTQKDGAIKTIFCQKMSCSNPVQKIVSKQANNILNTTYKLLNEMKGLSPSDKRYKRLDRQLSGLYAKPLVLDLGEKTKK